MTRARERAVAAVERWRRFQQARVAIEHAAARRDALAATRAHEAALQGASDAQSQRASLLSSPRLDLSLLGVAAQIEQTIWNRVEDCATARSEAQLRESEALERHRLANARTDVAGKRLERLRAHMREAWERRCSDDLADLHGARKDAT